MYKAYVYAFFIAVLVHITIIYAGEQLLNQNRSNNLLHPIDGTWPHTLQMEIVTPFVDMTYTQESYEQGETAAKRKDEHEDLSTRHTDSHAECYSAFKIIRISGSFHDIPNWKNRNNYLK